MRATALVVIIFLVAVPLLFGQQEVFKYDSRDKRDPFRPLVDKDGNIIPEARPASVTLQLNLEGIVWSKAGESYAIVSGTVLKEGDILGDYKVIKINKNEVVLNRAGEKFVLTSSSEEE